MSSGEGNSIARGQKQASEANLKLTNQVAGQQGANAQSLYGIAKPAYEQGLDSGYSDFEKSNIRTSALEGAEMPFASAADTLENRAARTRNSAGLNETLDLMARDRSKAASGAGRDVETLFANEKQRRREEALKGLAGLYGVSTDAMAKLYGLGPGTLEARAAGPGWAQGFGAVTKGIADIGNMFKQNNQGG